MKEVAVRGARSSFDEPAGPYAAAVTEAPITGQGRPNSRSALIDAALAEFTEKGYESATVNGIAERAGVTTGALYAHFRGKLDLLLETIGLRPVDNFLRDFYQAASKKSPHELAVSIGREMADSHAPETRLLLDVIVLVRRDVRLGGTIRRLLATKVQELASATEVGRASGIISPELSSQDLARAFVLIALGKMALAAVDEPLPTAASFVRIIEALLWSEAPNECRAPSALEEVAVRSLENNRTKVDFETAVLDAVEQGHSLRQVGEAAGVSHEQIRRIVGHGRRNRPGFDQRSPESQRSK
jgi:AcrR family transcriptional regulator